MFCTYRLFSSSTSDWRASTTSWCSLATVRRVVESYWTRSNPCAGSASSPCGTCVTNFFLDLTGTHVFLCFYLSVHLSGCLFVSLFTNLLDYWEVIPSDVWATILAVIMQFLSLQPNLPITKGYVFLSVSMTFCGRLIFPCEWTFRNSLFVSDELCKVRPWRQCVLWPTVWRCTWKNWLYYMVYTSMWEYWVS